MNPRLAVGVDVTVVRYGYDDSSVPLTFPSRRSSHSCCMAVCPTAEEKLCRSRKMALLRKGVPWEKLCGCGCVKEESSNPLSATKP